jgi:radical SAM superfamily enzyme YgiQ (UPF0313 family)
VLLVLPSYQGSFYEEPQPAPSVSLGYLAESLGRAEIPYSVCDMTLGHDTNYLVNRINRQGVDLVAITMMSFRYLQTYELVRQIKKHCSSVSVVIGGPHPSVWWGKTLSECPPLDYAVVGEGEYTIVELCRGVPLSEINGLVYRDGSKITFTGKRDFISDLDSISFPRYKGFDLDRYKTIHVTTSRGCPFQCTYCESHLVLGRKWRARSAQHVVDELEYWYRKGRRTFSLVEDNFVMDTGRVIAFCDEIQARHLSGLELDTGGLRADRVDGNVLERMWQAGFRSFGVGVEGGNDRVLKSLRKGEKIADIERCIQNACDIGFRVKLYFIVGSPYETWEDFQDSIRIAQKYPVETVNFYSMMPIPGTELFDWVQKEGRLLKPPEDYLNNDTPWSREPFFDGPGMSLEEKRHALIEGTRIRRKIEARTILRKKLGKVGVLFADILHDFPPLYSLIYARKAAHSASEKLNKFF